MSRQLILSIGILPLVFGSGIAIGLFMGAPAASEVSQASSETSTSESSPDATAEERIQGNDLLSSRIRELEQELDAQKKDQGAMIADRMAFFEKYHQQIGIQPFDESLKVNPEMAELLGLSKEQKQAVEQHLAEIKAELEKVEDVDTTLTKQTDKSVSYEISADKQGDALKEQLSGLLSGDMGDDKAKVFMDGSQWAFSSQFAGFLEDKRQIEISWTQQKSPQTYTIKQSSSNGSSWSSTGGIEPQYQKYLPANAAQ